MTLSLAQCSDNNSNSISSHTIQYTPGATSRSSFPSSTLAFAPSSNQTPSTEATAQQTTEHASPLHSTPTATTLVTTVSPLSAHITSSASHKDHYQTGQLEKRQEIWREPYTSSYSVSACNPITLEPGTFIIGDTTVVVPPEATNLPVFHPLCLHGRPVAGTVPISETSIVSNQADAWKAWISSGGGFSFSVVPLMYSIAASSATCWLLTLIVLGFQYKRPLLYKLSLLCASTYLLVVLITFTNILNDQFDNGFLDSIDLRHQLRESTKLNALNLAFNTILYLAQVQTAMTLFNRQKEKRMVLWLGVSLTIIAQTIWGISIFHPASAFHSLPAFAYLVQIAMGVLFTGCVLYYAITNPQSTLHPSMLLLSFLAIVAAASPIILFIVDLVNVWVIDWTDAISWVTTMLSIVTVREWSDRVYRLERHREKNGILGRQLYEDDDVGCAHLKSYPNSGNKSSKKPPSSSDSSSTLSASRPPARKDEHLSDLSGSTRDEERHSRQQDNSHFSQPGSHDIEMVNLSELPSTHHNNTSATPLNVTHAVIDSPFDPYEDKNIFVRILQKSVHPFIVASDAIINLGMSVSRPMSSSAGSPPPPPPSGQTPLVSPNNEQPDPEVALEIHDSHLSTTSSSSQLSLKKFIHPPRKSKRPSA